jgi:predicted SnoaL-like aldol condensation-catalyzing enzyme
MDTNKKIALRALIGAFVDRDPSVVEQYFTPDYIQHNPSIPNGPAQITEVIARLA